MIEEDAVVVKAVFDIGLGDVGSSRGPGDWRSGCRAAPHFGFNGYIAGEIAEHP